MEAVLAAALPGRGGVPVTPAATIGVTVNGEPRDFPAGATVAQLVAAIDQARSGVAAAVNGEVVPRRSWSGTPVREGDRVEIVSAVQGG
jgi:sulfur carrier protein